MYNTVHDWMKYFMDYLIGRIVSAVVTLYEPTTYATIALLAKLIRESGQ